MQRGLFLAAALGAARAIPSNPLYFPNLADHFLPNSSTFQQRYYVNESSFGGPGSPIICIMGGEGGIAPSTGIYYPSVVILAARLRALVIEPEHRFFGESVPTGAYSTANLGLLTAEQALADAAALITATRQARGCSGLAGQPLCPVITVGGSYPGWLAAMMRMRYPAVVDFAYSGSSPMLFYAQKVDQYAYYQRVTESAERASPGCPAAVRAMLASTLAVATKAQVAAQLNLCTPLPAYIAQGDDTVMRDEVSMVVSYTFADLNMGNYPPTNETRLALACAAIQATQPSSPWGALAGFLTSYSAAPPGAPAACYNLSAQLPAGAQATISSGDWSGVGTGQDGASWDYETCTYLVEAIGTNNVTDMFLPRAWSLEWLRQHCAARFGVAPQPRTLPTLWGFDPEVLPRVTSHIIFTSGLNDGWSVGGITTNLSDTLLAFTAPNGAHHSDLSHQWPGPQDTPDVTAMRASVAEVLEGWLRDLKARPAA